MKFLSFYIILFFLVVTACNNNTLETAETNNTDSNNVASSETITTTITTPPKPVVKPRFPAAAPNIHVGLTKEYQGPLFIDLVKPKQEQYNQAEAGQGSRSDTLYGVLDLPFKDQELYVYQTVFNHARGNSNQWCLAVIKNGETLVDEFVVTDKALFALVPDNMKVGDKKIKFTTINPDGSKERLELSYDGKVLKGI